MHGRSLIRAIDIGICAILIVAVIILSLVGFIGSELDRNALKTEASVVRAEVDRAMVVFRDDILATRSDFVDWAQQNRQERVLVSRREGAAFVRDAGLALSPPALASQNVQAQLRTAFDAMQAFDPQQQKFDFLRLGEGKAERLAFVTLLPGMPGAQRLAVQVLDTELMARHLEVFGLSLEGFRQGVAPSGLEGSLVLENLAGDRVGAFLWSGPRISTRISAVMLPILLGLLVVAVFFLLLLRRYWSVAETAFFADIKKVEALALTDPVTGLPNRRALFDRLVQFDADVAAARQGEAAPITMLMLDLDNFKWVNNSLGHQSGDLVLKQAAGIIAQHLGQNGFVARFGGDEFAAIMEGTLRQEALDALHEAITQDLRALITLERRNLGLGVTIGAVASQDHKLSGADLLKLADIAVLAGKGKGRSRALVFHDKMRMDEISRRNLERELRGAVEAQQLFLHHQPIVEAISGAITGYESLVRWNSPQRGMVSPAEFIPLAEQSDLIVKIGSFVLDRALAELGPIPDVTISVNATGRQLLSPGFAEEVMARLAEHQVAPARLCLELTETSLITEGEKVAGVMAALRAHGVRFAIDDFGAGYSSLGYLMAFTFDVLKIDRDFIIALDDKPESPMIVMSIVSLARSLGMKVVGEGVETEAQHRFLAGAGCTLLQGYLFGRPKPASDLFAARAPVEGAISGEIQVA